MEEIKKKSGAFKLRFDWYIYLLNLESPGIKINQFYASGSEPSGGITNKTANSHRDKIILFFKMKIS